MLAAGLGLAAAPAASAASAPGITAPAMSAPASITVPAAKKSSPTKYTSANLNQRKGIGTKHKVIRTIPKGTSLKVATTKSGWAKVAYKGKTGWVSGKYLVTKKPTAKKAPVKKHVAKNKVTKKSSSFTAQARSILRKYGCGSVGILLNDKRLGRYSNGVADRYNNDVLLRTSMPSYRLHYVAAHECMHLRQAKAYGGDIAALKKATNKVWGGSGLTGVERSADCMTRAKGIKVTNRAYASSCKGKQATATKRLLAGKRI